MKPLHAFRIAPRGGDRRTQRGVVLVFALIALAIIMIGSVALVRSFNTSLFSSGNLAFKRDLLNQGERVVPAVIDLMSIGALAPPAARANSVQGSNYSATTLQTNEQGIPMQLLVGDAGFTAGVPANDIQVPEQAVTIRYVIDRLCDGPGLDSALGADHCNTATPPPPAGDSASNMLSAMTPTAGGPSPIPVQVVYRLSVRVDGPRRTQAFFQTTFTL